MAGSKWEGAKKEMIRVARALAAKKGTTTVINVIAFNNNVTKFLDGELNEISAEISNLETWLNGLKPSGATAMKAGLSEAFSYYSGTFKAVYLITDGVPTDMGITEKDLATIDALNTNKLPIHVHAIEPSADYLQFLQSFALKNGGSYKRYKP